MFSLITIIKYKSKIDNQTDTKRTAVVHLHPQIAKAYRSGQSYTQSWLTDQLITLTNRINYKLRKYCTTTENR